MKEFNRIGIIISDLRKEVNLHQDLFGNPDSVKFINSVSPQAFSIIQQAMTFEVLSKVAALFDRAKFGNDFNLSLDYLKERVGIKISAELESDIDRLIVKYDSTGIKAFRNKALGHLDLKQYLGQRNLATDISYENISSILESLEQVVRRLSIESGAVPSDQVIYRDSKLSEWAGGKALLAKLGAAHNK